MNAPNPILEAIKAILDSGHQGKPESYNPTIPRELSKAKRDYETTLRDDRLDRQWLSTSTFLIERAKTTEAIHGVYICCHEDAKHLARRKWEELSLIEVEDANTVDSICRALARSQFGSLAHTSAKQKWERLSAEELQAAETSAQIAAAYHGAHRDSVTRTRALEKLKALLSLMLTETPVA